MDGAFRKINIDLLEEDVLLPSDLYDPDPRGPDGVLADAKNRSGEVRGLVSKSVKRFSHKRCVHHLGRPSPLLLGAVIISC
jgi:hypothetical protein